MSVLIETSMGDIVIDLFVKESPNACENFIKICKQKFYNGALFTNLQRDYLTSVQTLQPPKTIFGTQYFDDESLNVRIHDKIGIVATTNPGPNQNNSEFYITLASDNLETLNGRHTIFGQVQEGFDVLKAMNELHVDENHRPLLNVRIKHTVILEDPFEEPKGLKFPSRSPSPDYKGQGRLEYEEKEDVIDKMNAKSEQQLIELAQEHKAKSRAVVLEMLDDLPDADIKPPENILYVCRLNPVTEEKDLEIIFSKFGPIKECDIVRDWKTGQSLQYAFIEFESTPSCEEAYLKMENALIDDRRIHVDFCQSSAKQWAQLKKSQRKKKILHEQRNTSRNNRENTQTMIDQLEVKIDYFNTKNNFNYLVEAPKPNQQTLPSLPVLKDDPNFQVKQASKSKSAEKQKKEVFKRNVNKSRRSSSSSSNSSSTSNKSKSNKVSRSRSKSSKKIRRSRNTRYDHRRDDHKNHHKKQAQRSRN